MKYLLHRTRESLGGATALLIAAFVLLLGLPALAGPRAIHPGGEGEPGGGVSSNQRGVQLSAGDDELVGTLPIFDPDSGMPVPDDPEADEEDDDGEDDDDGGTPPNPGGGGLLTPPLPPVVGAPKLYLYGPYHLLSPCQAGLNAGVASEIHFDAVNQGYAFLVVDDSADLTLSESLFTIDGVEAGLLIGTDETAPVVGMVGYLGQYSRPFPLARGTKKVFPVAALAEYGFLADSVSLYTRSTSNGNAQLCVKGSGGDVTLSMMQF